MAAYVATHDRSALAKACEDTKVSVTQNTTHKDILGKLICLNQSMHWVNKLIWRIRNRRKVHIKLTCTCITGNKLQEDVRIRKHFLTRLLSLSLFVKVSFD